MRDQPSIPGCKASMSNLPCKLMIGQVGGCCCITASTVFTWHRRLVCKASIHTTSRWITILILIIYIRDFSARHVILTSRIVDGVIMLPGPATTKSFQMMGSKKFPVPITVPCMCSVWVSMSDEKTAKTCCAHAKCRRPL